MVDLDVPSSVQVGGGAVSVVTLLWWVIRGAHSRIDQTKKDLEATKLDLANHRIYSEGAYAKGATIDRLHARIDEMGKKTDEIYKLLVQKFGALNGL